MLFSDDAAVLSQTASGLQESLDSLTQYYYKWYVSMHIVKTTIVAFNKWGHLNKYIYYLLYISGKEFELINN